MQIGAKPWGTNKRSGGPCFSLLSLLIGEGRDDDHFLLRSPLFSASPLGFNQLLGSSLACHLGMSFKVLTHKSAHSMAVTP